MPPLWAQSGLFDSQFEWYRGGFGFRLIFSETEVFLFLKINLFQINEAPKERKEDNMKYDYLSIEKKWQDKWADAHIFGAQDFFGKA